MEFLPFFQLVSIPTRVIFLVFLLLPEGRLSFIMTMPFTKISSAGLRLKIHTTRTNIRSRIECAVLCKTGGELGEKFGAYDYRPLEKSCDLYVKGSTNLPTPGVDIFQMQLTDMFHTISHRGVQYSVYLSTSRLLYLDARVACTNMGAYLLRFDSTDEYEVVGLMASGLYEYSWVGANDLDNEGTWVTERDGTPITNKWIWKSGEPSGGTKENCAIIIYEFMKIYDTICDRGLTFLCEKDI